MARKNLVRNDQAESYYHIYNRGNEKRDIFLDKSDYEFFLQLISRYLAPLPIVNRGHEYPTFYQKIEVNAFCLMPNHFHLLIFQNEEGNVSLFLKSLLISYSMYFNKKYNRTGFLFESSYKASFITDNSYLLHISRYIHLNPDDYMNFQYSSYKFYTGNEKLHWLNTARILDLFSGNSYKQFVDDYSKTMQAKELMVTV